MKTTPLAKSLQMKAPLSSSHQNSAHTQKSLGYKPSEFARTRVLQEFELVFKEFLKAKKFESEKASLPYQRLQHHDPLKWKKKFKLLFEREKIIDFGPKHKT